MSEKVAVLGDSVGIGAITNCIQSHVTSPALVAVHGAIVSPHGDGEHASATMIATGHATISGIKIVVDGDLATCGCAVTATGHAKT